MGRVSHAPTGIAAPRRFIASSVALAAMMAIAAASARADITVHSSVNVTGEPEGDQGSPGAMYPLLITTYYKGDKARVEFPAGTATIYDQAAGRVYSLDVMRKTYSVVTLKQMSTPAASLRDS